MKFQENEIVLLLPTKNYAIGCEPYFGQEVTIRKCGVTSIKCTTKFPLYEIEAMDGKLMVAAEDILQKKPKRDFDKKVSWEEFRKETGLTWKPEKINE